MIYRNSGKIKLVNYTLIKGGKKLIESRAKISNIGVYLPDNMLTNFYFEKNLDTSDEWIYTRTGIKERRFAKDDEFSSDLAIKAVENLIKKKSITVDDVDMIIVSTCTPDHIIPNVSSLVQGHFKIKNCATVDLSAACTGFTYALSIANSLITVGQNKKILVIASETLSKILDFSDRNTCIIFGDGAAVALVERDSTEAGFIDAYFDTDGTQADKIHCTNLSQKVLNKPIEKKGKVEQDGKAIYRFVTREVMKGIMKLIEKANMTLDNIDWFIPHSANMRIIQELCTKMDFPIEKTLSSIEKFGNTSSASIPIALWMALEDNKIKKGDILLLYGFGGGLTQGGVIIKW